MNKYLKKGAYHFNEYSDPSTIYRKHVMDVMVRVKERIKPGMKTMDAGCGEGLFVKLMRDAGIDAIGVDIEPHAVRIARDLGLGEFVKQADFNGNYGKFDAILLLDCLEHMDNWRLVLMNSARNAKQLFIAVPDRHDRYGVSQILGPEIEAFMASDESWTLLHKERRYARDFFVYEAVQ